MIPTGIVLYTNFWSVGKKGDSAQKKKPNIDPKICFFFIIIHFSPAVYK